jgi:uncharacterized membrane protein
LIRFINPNYHVILIHFPLALLGVGLLIEILSPLWRDGSIRTAACWMVLLGALAAAPAATSGIFAKYDALSQRAGPDASSWSDVKQAAALTDLQWKLLNRHVLYASIGAALAVLAAAAWLAVSPEWPTALPSSLLVVFVASMLLQTVGAYSVGEAIYTTQFGTMGQPASDALKADWQKQTAAAPKADKLTRRIDYYIDPTQAHLIGAGFLASLAAAACGLSLRRPPHVLPRPEGQAPEEPAPPPVRATKAWALAALIGLLTLAVGWYIFARDLSSPIWAVRAIFRSEIWQPYQKDHANSARLLAHLLLGVGIVVLALLLIPTAHWGVSRLLPALLSLLILVIIAAQIGVGILMLYDGDSGPLMHFTPPSATSPPATVAQG